MGAFMVFGVIAVPFALFLLYCLTQEGRDGFERII